MRIRSNISHNNIWWDYLYVHQLCNAQCMIVQFQLLIKKGATSQNPALLVHNDLLRGPDRDLLRFNSVSVGLFILTNKSSKWPLYLEENIAWKINEIKVSIEFRVHGTRKQSLQTLYRTWHPGQNGTDLAWYPTQLWQNTLVLLGFIIRDKLCQGACNETRTWWQKKLIEIVKFCQSVWYRVWLLCCVICWTQYC